MKTKEMRILVLGDTVTGTSGFGRVLQNLCKRWADARVVIDLWGIGFYGLAYKTVPYIRELFPGGGGGDWCAVENFELLMQLILKRKEMGQGYTHLFILQDSFLLALHDFPKAMREVCRGAGVRTLYYFPVDAPWEPEWAAMVEAVDVAVAYTEYGKIEAHRALAALRAQRANPPTRGPRRTVTGPDGTQRAMDFLRAAPEPVYPDKEIHVLPHGVDRTLYRPFAPALRAETREKFWQDPWVKPDDLLLLNVNSNQRRKDPVRSLEILAALKRLGVAAKLVMHMPESSHSRTSLAAAGRQLGLAEDRDWGHHDHLFRGTFGMMREPDLVRLYNIADLYLTTTLGEGWGLGITEAIACGTPAAVPMHTACAEIATRLDEYGMEDACVPLPVEGHGVWLEGDNTRQRWRTDVNGAAERIAHWWASYQAQGCPRVGMVPAAVEWLSWDRVAGEFLKHF